MARREERDVEFATDAQRSCHERIAPLMRELFGPAVVVDDSTPSFGMRVGSAWVTTRITASGNDATIETRSWLVTGAELSADLLRFLLLANGEQRLGAFGIGADDDIFFAHAIDGSECSGQALRASILAVADAADRYDDLIVARFGGIRMTDRRV